MHAGLTAVVVLLDRQAKRRLDGGRNRLLLAAKFTHTTFVSGTRPYASHNDLPPGIEGRKISNSPAGSVGVGVDASTDSWANDRRSTEVVHRRPTV